MTSNKPFAILQKTIQAGNINFDSIITFRSIVTTKMQHFTGLLVVFIKLGLAYGILPKFVNPAIIASNFIPRR